MSSFINAGAYSSPWVLLVGLATFAGCTGLGLCLLRLGRERLPGPFHWIVAVLLGIHVSGLAVQVIAVAQIATPAALTGIWCASMACGAAGLAFFRPKASDRHLPPVPWIAIAIAAAAGGTNLLAGIVPSSKIDELYYHMLLPSRIVADQGLLVYRMPTESAILPQMAYQFFAAPLHALGYPDAPNIVSWLLSLMLVWLGWTLLRERNIASHAPYCLVAAIPTGAYAMVFHVTGGAHALGDLSLATAVVALGTAESFLVASHPAGLAFTVSLLAWSAVSSKVSLLALGAAVVGLGARVAWRALKPGDSRARVIMALATPWLVLGAPLIVWTYLKTGSPFGPLLAGQFGASLYAPEVFQEFADGARAANRPPLGVVLLDNLAGYSPLVWFGAVGALVSRTVPVLKRSLFGGLLLGQLAIIAWLLPYSARFLGGLQYGLAICFAVYGSASRLPGGRRSNALVLAIALGVAPWIAGQIAYVQQFGRMALGLENPDAFYRRYVAFYDDYVRLDNVLPRNAVLLVTDFRAPAVYSPRPMVFHPADAPPGCELYLFSSVEPRASDLPVRYVVMGEVYVNVNARRALFRRPWAEPDIGELHVTRIERN